MVFRTTPEQPRVHAQGTETHHTTAPQPPTPAPAPATPVVTATPTTQPSQTSSALRYIECAMLRVTCAMQAPQPVRPLPSPSVRTCCSRSSAASRSAVRIHTSHPHIALTPYSPAARCTVLCCGLVVGLSPATDPALEDVLTPSQYDALLSDEGMYAPPPHYTIVLVTCLMCVRAQLPWPPCCPCCPRPVMPPLPTSSQTSTVLSSLRYVCMCDMIRASCVCVCVCLCICVCVCV